MGQGVMATWPSRMEASTSCATIRGAGRVTPLTTSRIRLSIRRFPAKSPLHLTMCQTVRVEIATSFSITAWRPTTSRDIRSSSEISGQAMRHPWWTPGKWDVTTHGVLMSALTTTGHLPKLATKTVKFTMSSVFQSNVWANRRNRAGQMQTRLISWKSWCQCLFRRYEPRKSKFWSLATRLQARNSSNHVTWDP